MLKKLASLLFEEEEEVIEEELDQKPVPKKVTKPLVKEKVKDVDSTCKKCTCLHHINRMHNISNIRFHPIKIY